jgi:hypothetical protein
MERLFSSGIQIKGEADVRAAFEAYVDSVETAAGSYPDGETDWEYVTSRYFWVWEDEKYWQVDHMATHPSLGRLLRRLVYVSESGEVVWPLGCI